MKVSLPRFTTDHGIFSNLIFFYPRMDGLYFCHSCCIDVYLSFICSSIQEPAQGNWQQVKLFIYALSFYRSKIILDRPNCFGQVQNILVKFKLDFSLLTFIIWTCPKWFWPDQNKLDLSKTIGTRPKWFGRSKSFGTQRRTRHKSAHKNMLAHVCLFIYPIKVNLFWEGL